MDIDSHPQLPGLMSRIASAVEQTRGRPLVFGAILNEDEALVHTLARQGMVHDVKDPGYGSPMALACRLRNESMVSVLIELGVRPSMDDVLAAAESGSFGVFDVISAIKVSEVSAKGSTIFESGGPDWAPTLLTKCVTSGSADIFELAVKRFEIGCEQFLALDSGRAIPVLAALEGDKAGVLRVMLASGLDCDTRISVTRQGHTEGMTLLSYAAFNGSARCVRTLVDANASLTGYTHGMTPLQHAIAGASADFAGASTNALECAKLLLDAGADYAEKTMAGRSLVQLSSKNEELKTFLKSWVASKDISSAMNGVKNVSKPSGLESPF